MVACTAQSAIQVRSSCMPAFVCTHKGNPFKPIVTGPKKNPGRGGGRGLYEADARQGGGSAHNVGFFRKTGKVPAFRKVTGCRIARDHGPRCLSGAIFGSFSVKLPDVPVLAPKRL